MSAEFKFEIGFSLKPLGEFKFDVFSKMVSVLSLMIHSYLDSVIFWTILIETGLMRKNRNSKP